MTTVTVLAGERTIGGTQIVIEDHGARLLFDCGMAYDPAGNPFAHVRSRRPEALSDILTLGFAPVVPGLYRNTNPHLSPALPPDHGPLAVALSHSHLDHTHLAGFVDPTVPLYSSAETGRIIRVLGEAGHNSAPVTRAVGAVSPDGEFQVGYMNVRLLPVDHDVAGARGMLIETSEGTIAYSGDLRLHGKHPDRSLAFARNARAANARLLILEGTRLTPPSEEGAPPQESRREDEVVPLTVEALENVPGRLGVVLLTPENAERVEDMAAAVSAVGRLLVLDVEALAFVTAALGRPMLAPHAAYVPSTVPESSLPESYRSAIASAPEVLSANRIAADPGSYLLRLAFDRFADLLDLSPQGGVVVHANGQPLGRFHPAWDQLLWWIERLDMTLVQADSTGHAEPEALATIAAESGAPVVMAIHSRYPELMPVPPERLLLPLRGHRYELNMMG
ncbi:MAG: MBL fold metallo-hydrolase [Chloroflexota bacterium]